MISLIEKDYTKKIFYARMLFRYTTTIRKNNMKAEIIALNDKYTTAVRLLKERL